MCNHYLIPANFDYYNLDDLKSENEENGVCWSNVKGQKFNIGDIVYIYFHDVRRLTDCILLRGVVYKSDTADNDKENEGRYLFTEYCSKMLKEKKDTLGIEEIQEYEEGAKTKTKGFYLHEFKAISDKYIERFKYIHGSINDKNTGIMGVRVNRTKTCLNTQTDEKYKQLLEALKEQNVFTRSVESLRDKYNNDVCILCSKDKIKERSFLKPNNLYYYEIHHILQQSLNTQLGKGIEFKWFDTNKYKTDKDNKLIYNDFNEVRLCPYHHNRLHYGKYEDRKRDLDRLVNDEYKEKLKELTNSNDYKEIIKYIYEQYGLEYK